MRELMIREIAGYWWLSWQFKRAKNWQQQQNTDLARKEYEVYVQAMSDEDLLYEFNNVYNASQNLD